MIFGAMRAPLAKFASSRAYMDQPGNIILTAEIIRKKIERMAWQIYEEHAEEKRLIMAGIRDKGHIVARKIKAVLEEISPLEVEMIEVELDKANPLKATLSRTLDFSGSVIILVDDVANSGRTMLYAMKPLLEQLPRIIRTAVLIDRRHKSFPVCPDYSGYSLSTTLQDTILVEIQGEDILYACLA